MKKKNQIIKPEEVEFHEQKLLTAKVDGKIFAAMKPIVDGIGLNWSVQQKKIWRNKKKFNCILMDIVGKDGKFRKMIAMPIEKLHGWLLSINPEKVRPELRDTVILYQDECFQALYQYWHLGKAENPRFKNKDMDERIKANKLFDSLVNLNLNIGHNKSAARIMAMETLKQEYGIDIAASMQMSNKKAEIAIIKKYGWPSNREMKKSQCDWSDNILCQWLNAILEDSELWEISQTLNIQALYNNYTAFCQTFKKGCQSYNGWQRQLRKVFKEYIQTIQKNKESLRYYQFADLQTCRKQFEKHVGEKIWPSLKRLDIN